MTPAQRQLRLSRTVLLVAGVSYLGWWLLVHLVLPGAVNPFGSRVAVVACFLAAFAASYLSAGVARQLHGWLALCCGVATVHYFYLFDRNHGDLNWIIGSYILVTAVCAVLQTARSLRLYSLLVAALSVVVVLHTPSVPSVVFLPGLWTTLLFANLGLQGRLRLLERLQESHQRIESLFDSVFEGIAVHEGGTIREVNGALARLLGQPREELIGKDLAEILITPAGGPAVPHEAEARRKDGTRVTVEVSAKPHLLNGREAQLVALRDLTERKRAENTLRLLNRELEGFSYSVAHDLRAPLRAIHGFSGILVEDYAASLDGEARGYLDRIGAAAETMGQLIDALLALSRLSRTELRRESVDLARLADPVVKQLQALQPQRAVEFANEVTHPAEGDPTLLRAVLENLLGNAWKFTGARTPARITLGSTQAEAGPVYFVRDNGAGFDMAYANKLFVPFQRLHKVSEFAGTGIGLATVQRIILRHGGRIWAEGAVDQGATFYFTLHQGGPTP